MIETFDVSNVIVEPLAEMLEMISRDVTLSEISFFPTISRVDGIQ